MDIRLYFKYYRQWLNLLLLMIVGHIPVEKY